MCAKHEGQHQVCTKQGLRHLASVTASSPAKPPHPSFTLSCHASQHLEPRLRARKFLGRLLVLFTPLLQLLLQLTHNPL